MGLNRGRRRWGRTGRGMVEGCGCGMRGAPWRGCDGAGAWEGLHVGCIGGARCGAGVQGVNTWRFVWGTWYFYG
eukprot:363661-Chlamydomonas_euryale.AAC.3